MFTSEPLPLVTHAKTLFHFGRGSMLKFKKKSFK